MSGQIVDATLVSEPKQRNTGGEREAIKSGKGVMETWPNDLNKAVQKNTDARWTLMIGGMVRYRAVYSLWPIIVLPVFGCKLHISIDRRLRLHPGDGGNFSVSRRRASAPPGSQHEQCRLQSLGRLRLSFKAFREVVV